MEKKKTVVKKNRGLKFAVIVVGQVETFAMKEEVVLFVRDALESWGGQFDHADNLFRGLEVRKIQVEEIR